MTWSKTVKAYLATLNPETGTGARYGAALNEFAAWYRRTYGDMPEPDLLTDEEAREWRAHLIGDKELKAATVNLNLVALRGLVRHCGRRLRIENVRKVQSPIEPLDGRELGRLIAAVEGHRWGSDWLTSRNLALVGVLARAGLRLSEALELNTDDVDLRSRSGWALIRQGKGAKERQVPLNTELRRVVSEYLAARPEEMASEPALFVTRSGSRLGPRAVQRMVAGAARRAGIERQVTPHVLRHTFATRFLHKGGDLATLRAILGHSSIATTSRYLHPNATQMQNMVEGM